MRHGLLRENFLTGASLAVMTSSVQAQPEVLSLNKNTSHYMNLGQRITRTAELPIADLPPIPGGN